MFYTLISLFVMLGAWAIARDWARWHDVFHPTIFLVPQLMFLYIAFPIYGLGTDEFEFVSRAGGWDALFDFQLIATVMCLALILGVWLGCRSTRRTARPQPIVNTAAIFPVAIIFGVAGLTAWILGIMNVGGLYAAYGHAYGGGWDDSGYLREAAQFGFLATPLLILSRRNQGMLPRHWVLVIVFLIPLVLQGLLGARRGPTFLALAGVAGSYILVFRPRIRFVFVCCGAVLVGFLLLFLVTNRGAIYLGSEEKLNRSMSTMLENWSGNEYLFSSSIVRYVNETGGEFYGARILAHIGGRIIPAALWPSKYVDITTALGLDIDLTKTAGIPIDRIATFTGWGVANGAAPGFVGDLWMEFGLLAPLLAITVGWLYGRFWRLSRKDPRIQPVYVILAALSIYLMTQTIEAWLFRALLFGFPAFIVVRSCVGNRLGSAAQYRRHNSRLVTFGNR